MYTICEVEKGDQHGTILCSLISSSQAKDETEGVMTRQDEKAARLGQT
jgi:hypothetical protein